MEYTFIRDLKVGIKNVALTFIILEVGRPSTTKEGHEIRTCRIADRSGTIHLSVWGEIGTHIQPGDICRLTKGYVSLYKLIPTLYVGKGGELVKTGEFCFIFNETHNVSEQVGPNQQPVTAAAASAAGLANVQSNKLETDNSSPLTTVD